jgi:hypothetical protein
VSDEPIASARTDCFAIATEVAGDVLIGRKQTEDIHLTYKKALRERPSFLKDGLDRLGEPGSS